MDGPGSGQGVSPLANVRQLAASEESEDTCLGLGQDRTISDILVLHLGSGNSQFPELFESRLGCLNQIVTDISEVCIERMRIEADAKSRCSMKGGPNEELLEPALFLVADGCVLNEIGPAIEKRVRLPCRSNSNGTGSHCVDLVFEKSTIDALLCDDDAHALRIVLFLKEVHRVLRPGTGVFVCISFHPPRHLDVYFRLPCFGWMLDHVIAIEQERKEQHCTESRTGRRTVHYCYVLVRSERVEMDDHIWENVISKIRSEPDLDPPRKWVEQVIEEALSSGSYHDSQPRRWLHQPSNVKGQCHDDSTLRDLGAPLSRQDFCRVAT